MLIDGGSRTRPSSDNLISATVNWLSSRPCLREAFPHREETARGEQFLEIVARSEILQSLDLENPGFGTGHGIRDRLQLGQFALLQVGTVGVKKDVGAMELPGPGSLSADRAPPAGSAVSSSDFQLRHGRRRNSGAGACHRRDRDRNGNRRRSAIGNRNGRRHRSFRDLGAPLLRPLPRPRPHFTEAATGSIPGGGGKGGRGAVSS